MLKMAPAHKCGRVPFIAVRDLFWRSVLRHWAVIDIHFDILIIIAEIFPKYR